MNSDNEEEKEEMVELVTQLTIRINALERLLIKSEIFTEKKLLEETLSCMTDLRNYQEKIIEQENSKVII